MPTKWRCRFWDLARAACVIAREARQNALIRSLWWLEVKDCNENWHEGGHGHCQQNGVVGFGNARKQRIFRQATRQQQFMGKRKQVLMIIDRFESCISKKGNKQFIYAQGKEVSSQSIN